MPETTTDVLTEPEVPASVPLPGGGTGIRMPNGDLVNPSLQSVKGLVRAGEAEFQAVLAWLHHERSLLAERHAKDEADLAKRAESIRREVESRHATMAAYREKFPWKA